TEVSAPSAFSLIAIKERTLRHVSNVREGDVRYSPFISSQALKNAPMNSTRERSCDSKARTSCQRSYDNAREDAKQRTPAGDHRNGCGTYRQDCSYAALGGDRQHGSSNDRTRQRLQHSAHARRQL